MAADPTRARPVVAHGGLWQESKAPELLRRGVLDFSVNVNPYAPPPAIRGLLRMSGSLQLYPGPDPVRLTRALARHLRVPFESVLVGGGATELLFDTAAAFVRRGVRVIFPRHTYGEYDVNARAFGGEIRRVRMSDLRLDVDGLVESLTPGSVCFLCNPNNPTGEYVRLARLRPLLSRAQKVGARIVLDEALADFVRPRDDLVPMAIRKESLVVVRSFTKVLGLPGVRLGYAVGHPKTIRRLRRFRMPWSVTVLAERVGMAALLEGKFVERSVARIARERRRLSDDLATFPSDANFLLLNVGEASRAKVRLLSRGVYVRDCSSFGLPRHIRVAIRRPEENDRLLTALRSAGLDRL